MSALDELERLEREATAGPWRNGTSVHRTLYGFGNADGYTIEMLIGMLDEPADARLIVAMRNRLPALLKVARAAEAFVRAEAADHGPDGDYAEETSCAHEEALDGLHAALAELREVGK